MPPAGKKDTQFELPKNLPGAEAKPFVPPTFGPNTPKAQRDAEIAKAYPALTPVDVREVHAGRMMSLSDFQKIATENSPALRRAEADAHSAYGTAIQAGLYPNPTLGYQVDQWQPRLYIPPGAGFSGKGQQGGFVNQLIKTAGKLKYAQRVAGFDYINALVAVRKAQVDLTAQVRQYYFAALTAQKSLEVNRALAELADEVYQLQLKQLAAGTAAGYEPLQLYAQAVQARNAVSLSEIAYRASWRQLAATGGMPDLAEATLDGQADMPAPTFELEAAKATVLESHTDILTARNGIEQAKANLTLQQITPVPDLQTNQYHQYDNAAQTYQFGVQLGISLPIYDRNQGGIQRARGQIISSAENLRLNENNLLVKLAEAFGRYEANRVTAANYRDKVVPNLTHAYRALIRRYQVEPDKVGFNDIVLAQQNLATALQTYLTALGNQWQAVVDVANVMQIDELVLEK
jgi:cobalt-zinc-cadmium efflux system outer membrane protein